MNKDEQYYSEQSKNYAVVTVCTPNFIPGAMVMMYSYLKYNDWFKGDFVILIEEESADIKKYLKLFPNVKFKKVGEEIIKRAEIAAEQDIASNQFKSHFYSIELFNIPNYQKIIFIDSDILVLGSLLELFTKQDAMICVGDSFFYKDELRDGPSYNKYIPEKGEDISKRWGDNFNSGLIVMDQSVITLENYQNLVNMIVVEDNKSNRKRLHDQMIQNIYFRGQYTLVSAKYNYRIGIADEILKKDNIRLEDAAIIHYTARKKPWFFREAIDRILTKNTYFETFRLWQQHWLELMEELHEKHRKI